MTNTTKKNYSNNSSIKIAVVSMHSILGDVSANLSFAEKQIKVASDNHANLIVFPEFFTTGFSVNNKLLPAILASYDIEQQLSQLSQKYDIAIAGSYLHFNQDRQNVYNTMGLFFPTGENYFHNKDIPTASENFCYASDETPRIFHTPLGKIGIAICWEQLRTKTIVEMNEQPDFIITASAWWGFVPEDGEKTYQALAKENKKLAENAPVNLSKIFHCPVIHASLTGSYEGGSMLNSAILCTRPIESETMAIQTSDSSKPNYLLPPTKKEGCFFITLPFHSNDMFSQNEKQASFSFSKDDTWLFPLSPMLEQGFLQLNQKYHAIYLTKTKPFILSNQKNQ